MNENARLERLPKWAQDKIKRLEGEVESRDQLLEDLRGNSPPSDTQVCDTLQGDFYLRSGTRIQFTPHSGNTIEVHTDHDGYVRIYQDNLMVIPRASNAIYLK